MRRVLLGNRLFRGDEKRAREREREREVAYSPRERRELFSPRRPRTVRASRSSREGAAAPGASARVRPPGRRARGADGRDPRRTSDASRALELDLGALTARNARGGGFDRIDVAFSGADARVVKTADAGGARTSVSLAREPASFAATVWSRLEGGPPPSEGGESDDARRRDDDDDEEEDDDLSERADVAVRAVVPPTRLELSSADFKLLAECVGANFAETPSEIPRSTCPIDIPKANVPERPSPAPTTTSPPKKKETLSGSLETLNEDVLPGREASSGALDGVRPAFPPAPRRRTKLRVAVSAPRLSLALFRGDGRAEPLARLSLRGVDVRLAVSPSGASAARLELSAVALDDRRRQQRDEDGAMTRDKETTRDKEATTLDDDDETGGRPVARSLGMSSDPSASSSSSTTEDTDPPFLAVEYTSDPRSNRRVVDASLHRLRAEAEPTFLLDVARVFAPNLAGGGGEAPEEVLPRDLRLVRGRAYALTDADSDEPGGAVVLGETRRVLADEVAGGEYELTGRGRTIRVDDAFVLFAADASAGEKDPGALPAVFFVGPRATLTLRDVRVEAGFDAASPEAALARLARVGPGGRIVCAEGVAFARRPRPRSALRKSALRSAAPDPISESARGAAGADAVPPTAVTKAVPASSSFRFRAVSLELRVVGERDASTGEAADAMDLDFGVAADVTSETKALDAREDESSGEENHLGTETTAIVRLVRVGVRQPTAALAAPGGLLGEQQPALAGGVLLAPVDVAARYRSFVRAGRAPLAGAPLEDARCVVAASPASFAFSAARLDALAGSRPR